MAVLSLGESNDRSYINFKHMQIKRAQWWTGCMGPFLYCILPELVNMVLSLVLDL